MFYIVGLGNPGDEYRGTRHNIGWLALDAVCAAGNFRTPVASQQYSGEVTEGAIAEESVMALYPDTFMNNSGSAVVKLVPKGSERNLIVLHDEIALPFGEVKISVDRGDGGHNGVTSIIEKLGTKNFVRIRIGIAPRSLLTGEAKRPKGGGPLERFVLKPLTKKELAKLADINERVVTAVESIIKEGIETAMNKFN